MAGQWLAMLEQTAQSFCMQLFIRTSDQSATYNHQRGISLSQRPEDFKISIQGVLLVRYRDRVKIHMSDASASIPIIKEFAGMSFSKNGEFFCLWEREAILRDASQARRTSSPKNYWTIWSLGATESARRELVMLGEPITLPIPEYEPGKPTGEVLLLPFSNYPRFVACDRQQHLYLVRADSSRTRAHRLDRTDNAKAGFVLPGDENFLLICGSQQERQKARKYFMSFSNSPSLQTVLCGKLYDNIDPEFDGTTVMLSGLRDGSPCLLTLHSSGRLVRKIV